MDRGVALVLLGVGLGSLAGEFDPLPVYALSAAALLGVFALGHWLVIGRHHAEARIRLRQLGRSKLVGGPGCDGSGKPSTVALAVDVELRDDGAEPGILRAVKRDMTAARETVAAHRTLELRKPEFRWSSLSDPRPHRTRQPPFAVSSGVRLVGDFKVYLYFDAPAEKAASAISQIDSIRVPISYDVSASREPETDWHEITLELSIQPLRDAMARHWEKRMDEAPHFNWRRL